MGNYSTLVYGEIMYAEYKVSNKYIYSYCSYIYINRYARSSRWYKVPMV